MIVEDNASVRLEEAATLYRKGDLAGAEKAYMALLDASPGDPFLLGRLGVLALKQGRDAEGETWLSRALAAGGSPVVRLRNLYVYLGLLRHKGRVEEAGRLAAAHVVSWPQGVAPSPGERTMLLGLARSLSDLGQAQAGIRLLDQAFPDPFDDAEVLTAEARLRLKAGDFEQATRLFRRAVKLAPHEPAALIGLSAALERTGRGKEAKATVREVASRFPYFRNPRREGQTSTILVVNPPPRVIKDPAATIGELHFRVNYPGQFQRRMADRYRFVSVLETIAPDLRPWEADAPIVTLNNLVNEAEVARPGALERARGLVDRIGVPVINPPEAVVQVTREKNAVALAGIPGLRLPRMAHYQLSDARADAVVADIGRTIGYPAILRKPSTHSSWRSLQGEGPRSVYLVSTPGEAREALTESGWQRLYAIEFVDLRKKQGWYRKLRAAFMGDEIVVFHGGCFSDWIVAGWFTKPEGIAFYRAHPEAVDHLRAVLTDSKSELGENCLEVLRQIGERIPLDIFGIDFDVDESGQLVFFEATPGMVMAHAREGVPPDLWLPTEPLERIHAAFHDLVAKRAAERSPLSVAGPLN